MLRVGVRGIPTAAGTRSAPVRSVVRQGIRQFYVTAFVWRYLFGVCILRWLLERLSWTANVL